MCIGSQPTVQELFPPPIPRILLLSDMEYVTDAWTLSLFNITQLGYLFRKIYLYKSMQVNTKSTPPPNHSMLILLLWVSNGNNALDICCSL